MTAESLFLPATKRFGMVEDYPIRGSWSYFKSSLRTAAAEFPTLLTALSSSSFDT